jgi:hypothetical protein
LRFDQVLTRSAVPLGAARALVGAVVLARPTVLARALGVDSITAERTAWIARFFAGRDFALGIGSAGGSRGCQVAACASDVSDLAAVLLAVRSKHVRPLPGLLGALVAGGAAIGGGAALMVTRG